MRGRFPYNVYVAFTALFKVFVVLLLLLLLFFKFAKRINAGTHVDLPKHCLKPRQEIMIGFLTETFHRIYTVHLEYHLCY